MSEFISSFKSLRAGSQVFSLFMLFLCVILHTMWMGKSLQLLCILPFGMLCLSAVRMMFVKIHQFVTFINTNKASTKYVCVPIKDTVFNHKRCYTDIC